MNHTYSYLRNDRKIKFRMVSGQHFINEVHEALVLIPKHIGDFIYIAMFVGASEYTTLALPLWC